ncbi:hypothetical protein Tco_1506055 [Tanacetum coccineum]
MMVLFPLRRAETKVHKRKKTADDSQETVDASKESKPEPEPVKRKLLSISKLSLTTSEAARQVHATYARIVTEFVPDPTKIIKSSKVTSDPPKKLKGVPYLTLKEQEAADIMLALKERKKTRKRQPGDVNDENDKTESNEDDIYKYKIHVRKDDDEEMINVEVNDSDKGDEEITDAAKADAKKPSEEKDDPMKTELPPTNSSLSVSSGFGDQFLKLSSDSSLVSIVKDTTDIEINSLFEVKIQPEVPDTQSLSVLSVQVSVISEPTVPTPVWEFPSIATLIVAPRHKFPSVVDHKRKHDDDEDPPTRPNQSKQTKRKRTKDSESSKKPSTTKETPKGNALSKGSKTGKSAFAKEPVEEPIDELGIKSYQKKLNITPPQQIVPDTKFKEPYIPSHKPPGIIYEDLTKQKRVMRADELYKFSDGTLKKVRDELHHRIRDFWLEYNKEMPKRKWTAIDKKRSELIVELIDKKMHERRIIWNLERLVGTQELEMDYKLMTHTT